MRMTTKKLATMALLTAVALIVFIIEAQIPLPLPIPGVKLGLANTVTLFALFWGRMDVERASVSRASDSHADDKRAGNAKNTLTTAEVFMVLLCRIILGVVFTGRIIALIYSVAGGLLAFAAQAAMKRLVTNRQIWACGAVGAIFHNIGQILAAMIVTGTPSIVAYLPLLIIAGTITGVVTGLVAQFTLARLRGNDN